MFLLLPTGFKMHPVHPGENREYQSFCVQDVQARAFLSKAFLVLTGLQNRLSPSKKRLLSRTTFAELQRDLAGPVLGGWLIDKLSWRWIFFAISP
jgi:hypothetical protein